MAQIHQIRGALLEEAVLFLLRHVGYQLIESSTLFTTPLPGLRKGHSGLEARGRGTWHQLDALGQCTYSPPFMYPIRLVVEAKCYRSKKVGLEEIRNSVGVLKDIAENHFSFSLPGREFGGPRYNYVTAVFSATDYSRPAVEYAIAHQIFLIRYKHVPVIKPLIDAIKAFRTNHLRRGGKTPIANVRAYVRSLLWNKPVTESDRQALSVLGQEHIERAVVGCLRAINGSYFGMLQGVWPMHLLRTDPLPPNAFRRDVVRCTVTTTEDNNWKFVPINVSQNSQGWFELEFSLPEELAILVAEDEGDRLAVANIKQQHFSYIDITGIIGDIRRNVRLEMDRRWILDYVERLHRNTSRGAEAIY